MAKQHSSTTASPCGELPGLEWSEYHQRYFPTGHIPLTTQRSDITEHTTETIGEVEDYRATIASHPVDPRVLKALDPITVTTNTECAVCVQRIGQYDKCLQLPTCGHIYHWDCIMNWLNLKGHCPLCRAVVDESLAVAADSAAASATSSSS